MAPFWGFIWSLMDGVSSLLSRLAAPRVDPSRNPKDIPYLLAHATPGFLGYRISGLGSCNHKVEYPKQGI